MNGDSNRNGQGPLIEPLSEREVEILELIADNLTKREIAEKLSISHSTVKWYTKRSYSKLAVHSKRQAVQRARELGLLRRPAMVEVASDEEPDFRTPNPYKGLLAFQEADADNFFGRETLAKRLVARLGDKGEASHFLAVVGPSGSGKSSLVMAGLIPALRHGALPGSEQWLIVKMVPGRHPFEELEVGLQCITEKPFVNLREHLQQDAHGILQAARLAMPSDGSVLLLVIDQFEEIFTSVEDKDKAHRFLQALYVGVTERRSPLRVVVTLRADFFDRLLLAPDLSRLAQDRTEVVLPLSVDETERAIRLPAERAGVTMEPELVATLVADAVDQPGALPLLEYALTEIFEQRRGRWLSIEGYQATGGVRGVLERRAEATFARLSPAGQAAARQVFLRLVTLGEGVAAGGLPTPDTRRRILRSELEAVTLRPLSPSSDSDSQENEGATIVEALDAFGKTRLLFFDRDVQVHLPTVEIAHEALLSEWGRLRSWLEEGREGLRMQRLLGRATAEWAAAGYEASFLLRGARLDLFKGWAEETNLALTEEEHAFLEASLAQREAQQAAEVARLKREADLAEQAQEQARLATARELAAQAGNNLKVDPERSILLSLQSLRLADTKEAINALHRAIQSSRVRTTITVSSEKVWSVDFSPGGKELAAASEAGEVTVWDTGSWRKLFSLPGQVARYSPDGRRLATGSQDGTISVWDVATRQSLWTIKGHHQFIDRLRFSPDGRVLVSTSNDRTFNVWDADTGQRLFSSSAAYYASFSPDGRLLVTRDVTEFGSMIKLWRVDRDWVRLNQLPGYSDPVFSPDGRWLVMAGGETFSTGIFLIDFSNVNLESTDLSALKPKIVPAAHTLGIVNFSFSPDSLLLASASQDGTAKVWHLSNQGIEPLMTLCGHTGEVYDAAFSPDGVRLATAGQDGTVRIWDVTSAGASEWFVFAARYDSRYRLALTQDGRYLATAGYTDDTAKVWDLEKCKELLAINNHGGALYGTDISPDASRLATAGYDNVAKIWKLNLAAGTFAAEPQLILNGRATGPKVGDLFPGLTAAVFSPDGTRVATGGVDGMARIWDVKTGQQLLQDQVHPDHRGVTSLAFNPDGHLLATASDGPNPLAKIWNAENGAEVSTYSGLHQFDRIWGLAFSPDGKRVASSSQGGGLKIWDAQTGQELLNFQGHTSTIVGVAFSPDGKYLASASTDGTARVWDAYSGEELQRYTSPTGALHDIAFTPDGKRLVVSGTGAIYGYFFDREELVRLAKSRLTRGLTPEECRQFLHLEECPPQ